MPDDVQFSRDGQTRIEFTAWTHSYFAYKSIGTQVQVRRKGTSTFLFWTRTTWDATPASSIQITNRYSGLPGPISQQRSGSNTGDLDLKEWAVGASITIQGGGSPVSPGAVLDLHWVSGIASVVLPDGESFTLHATAGSGAPPS